MTDSPWPKVSPPSPPEKPAQGSPDEKDNFIEIALFSQTEPLVERALKNHVLPRSRPKLSPPINTHITSTISANQLRRLTLELTILSISKLKQSPGALIHRRGGLQATPIARTIVQETVNNEMSRRKAKDN